MTYQTYLTPDSSRVAERRWLDELLGAMLQISKLDLNCVNQLDLNYGYVDQSQGFSGQSIKLAIERGNWAISPDVLGLVLRETISDRVAVPGLREPPVRHVDEFCCLIVPLGERDTRFGTRLAPPVAKSASRPRESRPNH